MSDSEQAQSPAPTAPSNRVATVRVYDMATRGGGRIHGVWVVQITSNGKVSTDVHTSPTAAEDAVTRFVQRTPWFRTHRPQVKGKELVDTYFSENPVDSFRIIPSKLSTDGGPTTWHHTIDANDLFDLAGQALYEHPYVQQFLNQLSPDHVDGTFHQIAMFHNDLNAATEALRNEVVQKLMTDARFHRDAWGSWVPGIRFDAPIASIPLAGVPHYVSADSVAGFINSHASEVTNTRQWETIRSWDCATIRAAIGKYAGTDRFTDNEAVARAVIKDLFAAAGVTAPSFTAIRHTGEAA